VSTLTRVRRPQARGDRARQAILETAMARATVDGLDGLSLGNLAADLGVSKAGLFAHFPSKEALQLAVVDHAVAQFIAGVVEPALAESSRLRRLWRAFELNLTWKGTDLPGGCFFTNTQVEFDARPGPVRDRLTDSLAGWLRFLVRLAGSAKKHGDLRPDTDPELLAFELHAYCAAATYQSRLIPELCGRTHARAAGLNRLRVLATDPSPLPEASP
jgi:AcrR family transcriptional regulator